MLDVAIEAAKAANRIASQYFQTSLKVTLKTQSAHTSPVTKADKKAELAARKIISEKFPDHGFIGEEFGKTKPHAKYHWVIDPLDGTRDFIRGGPFWSTLIAVLENETPIIGVAYFFNSKELFYAQKGKGSFLDGKRIYVSRVKDIGTSYLLTSAPHHFASHGKISQLVKLCQKSGTNRYVSSFSNALVFKGIADAFVNARGGIWDFAAPAVICEEAGGKWSDFEGKKSLTSDCFIISNGLIHGQVLKILNS